MGGDRARMHPRLVAGASARSEVLARFRAKYGDDAVARWFPHPGRMLRFSTPGTDPSDPYRSWLAQEFDAAADEYVQRVQSNPVEAAARRRSIDILLRAFHGRSRLLELGSGPGLETVALLEAGHTITALDVSSTMLRRLEERASESGARDRLTTANLSLAELDRLGPDRFDGAYSTFGALNCEPDLARLREPLAARLGSGAPFVAGIFNPVSLPELAWFGLSGHPGRALARLRPTVPVGRSRFAVDWFTYRPRELERAFAPEFRREDTAGIGVVVPPPELVVRLDRTPDLLSGLLRVDPILARSAIGRHLGDHLLLRFRRAAVAG